MSNDTYVCLSLHKCCTLYEVVVKKRCLLNTRTETLESNDVKTNKQTN